MLRLYVIAAHTWAPRVRVIHDRLRTMGVEPTSQWAEQMTGPENLDAHSDDECQRIWLNNAADMGEASVILALCDSPMREGWLELGRAFQTHRTILLVGRHALTTRVLSSVERSGITRFESVDGALTAVALMSNAPRAAAGG